MTRKNIHPAVLATLSTSLFMLPTTAHAVTTLDTLKRTLTTVGPSWGIYAMGMVAGASLYHAVCVKRTERKECEQIARGFQTAGQHFSSIAWSTPDNCDYEEVAERYVQAIAAHDKVSEQPTSRELDGVPVIPRGQSTASTSTTSQWQMSVPDISSDDMWQATLSAIDERAQETTDFSFIDIVGDGDTLDEPEGLESPTVFIPFKAPAGHPEIVDTDSYVDYLISDEFARNSSKAAQRSPQFFLKVIEGGSQAMPRLSAQKLEQKASSQEARRQGPRHLAQSMAIEA